MSLRLYGEEFLGQVFNCPPLPISREERLEYVRVVKFCDLNIEPVIPVRKTRHLYLSGGQAKTRQENHEAYRVAKMARMSKEDALKYASDLYLKTYWLPAGCDILPYPKDVIIFDITINPGLSWSRR